MIYFHPILVRLLLILLSRKKGRDLVILFIILDHLTLVPSRVLYDGLWESLLLIVKVEDLVACIVMNKNVTNNIRKILLIIT